MKTLKNLRQKKGVTQQYVADFLNVTQQSYGRYELDLIEPPYDILIKLSEFYNVSIDYLLGRTLNDEPVKLEHDFQIMHRAYQGMDEKQKDKLKKILELTFDIAFDGEPKDDKN